MFKCLHFQMQWLGTEEKIVVSEYLHAKGVIFQAKASIFQSNRGKPVVLAHLHQEAINI